MRSCWRGGELTIEVCDTGVGIAPEYLDKLFEKGFVLRDSLNHHSSNTLEFKSAGLGLGLSIARGIVEAHGGTISVESKLGEGSVFTIRLSRSARRSWRRRRERTVGAREAVGGTRRSDSLWARRLVWRARLAVATRGRHHDV